MYIRACILVIILSIVFSVLFFYLCAVAQVKAQRKSTYQTLDEYTQNNAITISDNIKILSDKTDTLDPEAFITQLCDAQNLEVTDEGLVATSASGSQRFIVSDISLSFTVEETTNIHTTYTLLVPLNFLGRIVWIDVPMTVTTELRAKFTDGEDYLDIAVDSYYGLYDGAAHGISVTCNHSDAQILYGYADGICYLAESPTYTDPGTYVLSYSVSKTNYDTVNGFVLMQIYAQDAWLLDVDASGWSGVYDGLAHGIIVSCTQEGISVFYGASADDITMTESPTYIAAGVYTVYYRVEKEGYEPVFGSENIEITPYTYPGLYDANGVLIADWDALQHDYKIDFTSDYSASTYATDENSLYYLLYESGGYPELADSAVLVLGSDLTSIGAYALYGCSDLVSVVIPESVTHIGAYAFGGCQGLLSVTFEGNGTWLVDTVEVSTADPVQNAFWVADDYVQYAWTLQ